MGTVSGISGVALWRKACVAVLCVDVKGVLDRDACLMVKMKNRCKMYDVIMSYVENGKKLCKMYAALYRK